jgi:hypothetical protein
MLRSLGIRKWPRKKRATSHPKGSIEDLLAKGAIAEAGANASKMHSLSYKLLRLERYQEAWELRVRAASLSEMSSLPEWEGGDLSTRGIVVRVWAPKHRVGDELRLSRFIAPVAKRAKRCVVLAERRLVPLLRRSFPETDVYARETYRAESIADADVAAYYETIALHLIKNTGDLERSFVRLCADPLLVGSLRRRYRSKASGPLIGISWASKTANKVLPDLSSWAPLLNWPAATFVSLQYGATKYDLELMRQLAGGRMIHDSEIDSLIDLDAFAAQISALDAVVSISNTTIDMAGMLGVPTLHIRDDRAHGIWPDTGPSAWYPEMIFVRRKQRAWPDALAEARCRLEHVISTSARVT